MQRKNVLLSLLLVLLAASPVSASDWPQYLGPERNAVSDETGLKRSWPESGPKVLWTVKLGEGFGGAAVKDGRVYVYDRVDNDKNVLRSFDIESGKELWTWTYPVPGSVSYNGSRSVPTLDGGRIYVCGAFGNLHCLDLDTREVLWHANIWSGFGGGDRLPRWAIAQSPLVYRDLLIAAAQTDRAGIAAFDKITGELRWKTPALPGKAGYVSPVIVRIAGENHLVMISANGAVSGFDPENGGHLWSYDDWQCKIPVPNVTETGNDRLFITGGYEAGSAHIRILKDGGDYRVEELFRIDEFGTHVHPPVLHEGYLYGHCTTNEVADGMVCMDLEGNVRWKTRRDPFFNKGGFILVDGLIVSVDGEKGDLYLIDPSPGGFKPLSKARLLDTKMCWAPLALSNGRLLIRDQEQMKCVQLT
jgi:outer membrane protein assembly factor BamB